jgi:hypothetical protein
MTYGGGGGVHSVHRVWPHQAKLVSKISDTTVLLSLTHSQTSSWTQQYHLDLIITTFIQFEILECVDEVEGTRFVIYAEPRLETAFDIDEGVESVTVHVKPGSRSSSRCEAPPNITDWGRDSTGDKFPGNQVGRKLGCWAHRCCAHWELESIEDFTSIRGGGLQELVRRGGYDL